MDSASTDDPIAARLQRYTPVYLSADAWSLAKEPVLSAVLAARPANQDVARQLTSKVCWFLSHLPQSVWDGASEPNLADLLTLDRILTATDPRNATDLSIGTAGVFRCQLKRVHRAVYGLGDPVRKKTATPTPVMYNFWTLLAPQFPITVLVAAMKDAYGRQLHPRSWNGIGDALVQDMRVLTNRASAAVRGIAAVQARGILLGVRASAADLRDASMPIQEVSPANPQRTAADATKAQALPSRAEAMRAKRAELRAEKNARPVATIKPLPQLLAEILEHFTPDKVESKVWESVREATHAAVQAYAPETASALRNVTSVLVRYCIWLQGRPQRTVDGKLTVEELLDADLVDRYVNGPMARKPRDSRATVRSVLRRTVTNLKPGDAPEKFPRQPLKPPYRHDECLRFELLARQQPTRALQRQLASLVALGLGAGLDSRDQRYITPECIREVDLGVHGKALAVMVPGEGPRARTVIVRREYEPLLREALALHKAEGRKRSDLLYGQVPERTQVASRVAEKSQTATGAGIEISA